VILFSVDFPTCSSILPPLWDSRSQYTIQTKEERLHLASQCRQENGEKEYEYAETLATEMHLFER